ncbi:leucine-rich repeat-containing protein 23-like [Anabrus simplex]|uniref:leucine-rich repeat-containing protein 23-like n=1 Tax=Anabrus simplex TaxID=316456 RepID=UPI0035A2D9B4
MEDEDSDDIGEEEQSNIDLSEAGEREEEEEEGEERERRSDEEEEELRSEKLSATASFIEKEEEEEEEAPHVLTKEEAGKCLCLLGKAANGIEYAYLMLKANNLGLTDISVIPSFKHVLFVDVIGNRLKDDALEVLANMEFLLMIKADENRLRSARITTMPYLQVLTLNKNEITSTEGIEHPLLQCLELNYNRIKEVSCLNPKVLNRLKVLELRGNSLLTTARIRFPTLESLYLAENKIEKLVDFQFLVNLRTLHLRDNPLSNLDGFSEKMASLSYLNLRKCNIQDMNEFKKLAILPMLDKLVISENPFIEEMEEDYKSTVLSFLPKLKRLNKGLVQQYEMGEGSWEEDEDDEND